MAEKITRDDGTEVEVYTADEVKAAADTAVKAKEAEFTPIKTQLEKDLLETKTALNERSGEFTRFRKLSEEQANKLSVAERTIYDNQLASQKAEEKRAADEKAAYEKTVDSVIRGKAGTDEKLFTKMKDTWSIIGIEAKTPDEIERKLGMVIGAIKQTEPDLVASVAGFGGSAMPQKKDAEGDGKSFADTEKGKSFAKELGLNLEPPKQQ